ncbi:MAG: response regulator transcription factor [Deltaproteobacteria bacterium]|nr:response regulator transcription factor [Deltaproteobacteria bacterium]
MKVLIADDHKLMREGLARLLGEAQDISVVAQAADGYEALLLAKQETPDVAVLDVSMPGKGGMDTLAELKRALPHIRILMLSMHPEDQYAVRLMKEGADGYMTKESAPEELLTAIRRIHLGGKYVSTTLAEALVEHLESGNDIDAHDSLSHREFQVMCQLASGKTVGEIADELDLSVKTISTYRTRILQKMHLKNTAQIMHYGLQKGLAEPQPS